MAMAVSLHSFHGLHSLEQRETHKPWWRKRFVGSPRAVGSSLPAECVEAKGVIDGLLSKAPASVSWALYEDQGVQRLLGESVEKLCASAVDSGPFLSSKDGFGVWEVFYAPHISRISKAFGARINPLRYVLSTSGFTSNVGYMSPIGVGWLSASGDFVVKDNKTVEVLFDSFWWDIGRNNLQPDPKGEGTIGRTLVNLAGRGAFFPALSVYPVHYADADVTVFEFTPLRTKIAARKITRS